MKPQTNLILLALLTFIISGCSDFLEEETRGIITPSNFFNNDEEAILAINGIYRTYASRQTDASNLIGLYGRFDQIMSITAYGADEIGLHRSAGAPTVVPYENFSINESNYGLLRLVWQSLYHIIGDANTIIANVVGNTNLSDEVRNRVEGEALFLRAFAYYHLTNAWGDVPFYTDVLDLSEISTLGREDVDVVRNAIIGDLTDIENRNLLPQSYNGSDLGRPTVWATKMLKAKIMLWQENWQGVLDETTDIINDSPHFLLNNYADVFERDINPFNQEIIWGIDHFDNASGNAETATGNQITDAFNPQRGPQEPLNPNDRAALVNALSSIGQEFNGFAHAVALPSFRDEFPSDDLRRPLNLVNEYLGFPLIHTYLPKHWNLDGVASPRFNHGDMIIIFRLADVYLMAGEAANELGNTGGALQYVNKVRERAYEPDQPLIGLSQGELRQMIYDERKWELAGEGHRRYDLVRWGILVETIQNTNRNSLFDTDAKTNVSSIHERFPIPAEELILNPALLASDPTNNGYR